MDGLGKPNDTFLPEKQDSYGHLNMQDIDDADYEHEKRVCKDFKNKTFRWIPWFICSKWYITAIWRFRQLLEYVL